MASGQPLEQALCQRLTRWNCRELGVQDHKPAVEDSHTRWALRHLLPSLLACNHFDSYSPIPATYMRPRWMHSRGISRPSCPVSSSHCLPTRPTRPWSSSFKRSSTRPVEHSLGASRLVRESPRWSVLSLLSQGSSDFPSRSTDMANHSNATAWRRCERFRYTPYSFKGRATPMATRRRCGA